MMQDDSPPREAPEDRMTASTPQADWSFDEVEKVARMLYEHAPSAVKDEERWKALVQQAFDFLDNLRAAWEAILGERMERREIVAEASQRALAARHLPFRVPFERAVRFITGQIRKDRALSNFVKVLHYDARRTHPWPRRYYPHRISQTWPSNALTELPAKKERRLEAQIKMWRKEGIPRYELVRLRWLFQEQWPLVIAERNRARRTKHKRRARVPRDSNIKKIIAAIVREQI
jgi:hypothetical protein